MKPRLIGAILVGAAVAASACKGDPTANLRNGAAALSVTPSTVVVDPGTVVPVVVVVQDAQLNPLIGDVTASTSDAALATVAVDTSRHFPDASTHAFNVTTVGLDGGQPLINFATGSVTTPLVVKLNPVEFDGAISSATPPGGSTITIHSTAVLKLDQVSAVTFGGVAGTLLTADTDSVRVIVPFSSGTLKLANVYPRYMSKAFVFTLPYKSAVTQTGNFWAGDSTPGTAPAVVLPAAGKSTPMITTLFSGANNAASCPDATAQGPCMFYTLSPAVAESLKFSVTWDGSPADSTNVDIFACASPYSAATCGATPEAAGRTAKRPESFTLKFPAGTHYFVIERNSTKATTPGPTTAPKNFRITISRF